MADDHQLEVASYGAAVSDHLDSRGVDLCEGVTESAISLLNWLVYLRKSQVTTIADVLLDGVQGAVVETVGCVVVGLARPALFSMRSEIDMALGWIYFKNHLIEWDHLRVTGRGFLSKREIEKYLAEHYPKYKTRYSLLEQTMRRREGDPYRGLSAHIHGQTDLTVPRVGPLVELVGNGRRCEEIIELQRDVAEYICDVLLSVFADRWTSLPDDVKEPLGERLSEQQRGAFFAA